MRHKLLLFLALLAGVMACNIDFTDVKLPVNTGGTNTGTVGGSNCVGIVILNQPTSGLTALVGAQLQFTDSVAFYPSGCATSKAVTWTSSDTTVASVSQTGLVTTLKVGTSAICTALNLNLSIIDCKNVVVTTTSSACVATGVNWISTLNATMAPGQKDTVVALTTVLPLGCATPAVKYSASGSITVDSVGVVTAGNTAGTGTVVARSVFDTTKFSTLTTTVSVVSSSCVVTGVSWSSTVSASLNSGQKDTATAVVGSIPVGCDSLGVTYTSRRGLVTVDSVGIITAGNTAGLDTVVARSRRDTTKLTMLFVSVVVPPPPPTPTSISLRPSTLALTIGQMYQDTVMVSRANFAVDTNKAGTFSCTSSDTTVVKSDSACRVTGIGAGIANITACVAPAVTPSLCNVQFVSVSAPPPIILTPVSDSGKVGVTIDTVTAVVTPAGAVISFYSTNAFVVSVVAKDITYPTVTNGWAAGFHKAGEIRYLSVGTTQVCASLDANPSIFACVTRKSMP